MMNKKKYNLKNIIKYVISLFIYYTGILFIWKLIYKRHQILIIYYHDIIDKYEVDEKLYEARNYISSNLFREQLDFIRRKYKIVDLNDAINNKECDKIVITFDDGFKGVYRFAFPVFMEMNIKATIFIITDFIGSNILPWWEELYYMLKEHYKSEKEIKNSIYKKLCNKWVSLLKYSKSIDDIIIAYKLASKNERTELRNVLSEYYHCNINSCEEIYLSEKQIKEMSQNGINFGSHTKSHPILLWLNEDDLKIELNESKKVVEKITGQTSCWIAYPDGYYGEREETLIDNIGYVGAVQTFRYPEKGGRYSLKRVGIHDKDIIGLNGKFSPAKLEVLLSGFNKKNIKKLIKNIFKDIYNKKQ